MIRDHVRRMLFLPLGLLASILAGGVALSITSLVGGTAWYVWIISGAVAAWAFLVVALRIAPQATPGVKRLAVGAVAVVGLLSALGAIQSGSEPVSALAGLAMAAFGLYAAKRRVRLVPAPTFAERADARESDRSLS